MTKKIKIMLLLCSILSIGFIATSMVGYFVARDSLTSQLTTDTLPLIGDNIYSEIQRDLLKPIIISSLMANDTFLKDWVQKGEQDPSKIQKYLRKIQSSYGAVTSFFISDRTLNYYHSSGILKKISPTAKSDLWYQNAKKITTTHELNIDFDESKNNALTVFINYKLFDDKGDFLGITGVGLALSKVQQLIEEYQEKYQREVFFINSKGKVTLHGSAYKGDIDFDNIVEGISVNKRILNRANASIKYKKGMETILINSRFLKQFDWYLIIREDSQSINKNVFSSLVVNLLISLIITVVVLGFTWFTLSGYQRQLEKMAITDKLTGLNNRQMFDPILEQMFNLSTRHKSELSVIVIDIDNFKHINDQYGHPFGDKVLIEIANLLKSSTRESDVLCRWGGEEFLILMPNTSCEVAKTFALQIQHNFSEHQFNIDNNEVDIKISAGISQKTIDDAASHLIYRADQALLKAKQNGRNQIAIG